MKKYEALAQTIVDNIGGKKNVKGLTHCITRLRFTLHDESVANKEILESTEGIVTVMQSAGQYQVVIGNHVGEVYEEVNEILGGGQEAEGGSGSLFDIISGIFQPSLGILAASGMTKGLLALALYMNLLSNTDGAYIIFNAIGDAIFAFFPIILGYNASKKFKMNPYVAMIIGAALVYPGINALGTGEALYTLFEGTIFASPVYYTFFGIPIIFPVTTYGSTVIPIIFAVFVGSKVETFVRNITPRVLRSFLVPLFTLLIVVPLTFLVIGPIANMLSALIGEVIMRGFNFSPLIAGLVLGGIWQLLVIFGLHWGVVSLGIVLIGQVGYDAILPIITPVSFAQTAVITAIAIKTKDKNLRSLAMPSIVSGIFGVTEPAIYGITLPRIKMFIISCIGGALGGAYVGFMGLKAYGIGALGIFALPQMIQQGSNDLSGITHSVIAIGIAVVFSFVATMVLFKDDEPVVETKSEPKEPLNKKDVITSPIKGKTLPLNQVADSAFAKEALGKGAAIIPSEGRVVAPFDAEVSVLFPTKHAIGLVSEEGIELLVHIGMNTVELDGKHFTQHVQQGDKVKKGDLLITFDIEGIAEEGYSLETPVIITNTANYFDVLETKEPQVDVENVLITVLY